MPRERVIEHAVRPGRACSSPAIRSADAEVLGLEEAAPVQCREVFDAFPEGADPVFIVEIEVADAQRIEDGRDAGNRALRVMGEEGRA